MFQPFEPWGLFGETLGGGPPGAVHHGVLDPGQADTLSVYLQAGATYSFLLVGTGALDDGLTDPLLRVFDSTGSLVAEDDDGGPGYSGKLSFTALSDGLHVIDIRSYDGLDAGRYALSMAEGDTPVVDVTMAAGVLLRADRSWSATPETAASLSWAAREDGTPTDVQGAPAPFSALSAAQIIATEAALAAFSDIAMIEFQPVPPGETGDMATLLVGGYASQGDGAAAYAFLPGSTSPASSAGDIWLNSTVMDQVGMEQGSYGFFVLLHEIGHALGLDHPGDYAEAGDPFGGFASLAPFAQDTRQFTVMSYFDESHSTSPFASFPDTPLLFDVAAIQALYGPRATFQAGDSTYGFNVARVAPVFDFTLNTDPVLTIWDGGGTDLIDLSGFDIPQALNLGAGTFSDIAGLVGNLSIAIGAEIENALGGTGDDELAGNDLANRLSGNLGSDRIVGLGGDDIIFGDLEGFYLVGGRDLIRGGAGDDWIDGGRERDTVYGGEGDDTIFGFTSHDRLYGEDGDDRIEASNGSDYVRGGAGNDYLTGGRDADSLFGDAGNDQLRGGSEDDVLRGGDGNDILWGQFGRDRFVFEGDFGRDAIFDYEPGEILDFRDVPEITDWADLVTNHLSETAGGSSRITVGDNLLTISAVANAELSPDDFWF